MTILLYYKQLFIAYGKPTDTKFKEKETMCFLKTSSDGKYIYIW